MSVENVDSGSAAAGFPDRRDNMREDGVKNEKQETPVSSNSNETASSPAMMDAEFSSETQSINPNETDITAWMSGLTENELLSVFTIDDLPFLASISAISSWSSSAAVKGQADRSFGGRVDNSIPWRHLVSPLEIRAVHSRISDDLKTGESVLDTSRWLASIQASIEGNRTMSSDVDEKSISLDDNDDIRIRNEGTGVGDEMSDVQVFWLLLDHVRVVFPSALSHVTGQARSSSTLLTFSPSILRRFGAHKIHQALNAGLQLFLPGKRFLLSPSSKEKWLDSLVSFSEREEKDGLQIPMFALLLFRLEHAFLVAYQASRAISAHVGDGQAVSESEEKNEETPSLNYRSLAYDLDRCMNKLQEVNISDDEMKSIVGELAKACGDADLRSIHIADLLATPLALVSRSMDNDGIGSLVALDDIIKTALERYASIVTSKKTASGADKTATKDVFTASQTVQSQSIRQDNGAQKANAKKKKKRKTKKKQGKGRAADNQKSDANGLEPAKAGVNSNSSEIEKKENKQDDEYASTPESSALQQKSEEQICPGEEAKSVAKETLVETKPAVSAPSKAEKVAKATVETRTSASSSGQEVVSIKSIEENHDDGDTWETVEVKPRNQRKKGTGTPSRNSTNNGSGSNDGSSKKAKEKRTSQSRRKNATRKMVRDILSGVVDSVEEESSRKQKLAAASVSSENRWKKGPPLSGVGKPAAAVPAETVPSQAKTLRDIVVGGGINNSGRNPTVGTSSSTGSNEMRRGSHSNESIIKAPVAADNSIRRLSHVDSAKRRPSANVGERPKKNIQQPKSPAKKPDPTPESPKRPPIEKSASKVGNVTDSPTKSPAGKWPKGKNAVVADQNTAPTYQETVSAMSGTSNRADRIATKTNQLEPSKSDSSFGDTDEAPQNRERASSPVEKETTSSGPPLLTFVSPENANSATSSVASSLEVPHTSRRHHHSASTPDATDVGYHLLDVCDRLSRDMKLFMESRDQAIQVRRRERGAVLAALQNSLSKIWPEMCRVEMYGSCATMLDLPSADLDVVVVGLDHSEMERILASQIVASQQKQKRSNGTGGKHRRSQSKDGASATDSGGTSQSQVAPPPPVSPHVHHGAYVPLPMYRNSERVKQLALQLEGQPWAVQIKSLPNATVPVIKILADPSKLAGLALTEWPTPISLDDGTGVPDKTTTPSVPNEASAPSQNIYEPWRGSDVMNGLISLDITFEGPEHGGLGSTDFSVHVVNEACQETGLTPDATPFVQCLMVLKELLVQRKLNEPYSGGLSSYALLLLLLALVRERELIRQEIERVEFQRQAMAEGGVATYAGALSGTLDNEKLPTSAPADAEEMTASTMKHTRSWANIAKQPNPTPTPSVSSESPEKKGGQRGDKAILDRPASFADAVARPVSIPKGKNAVQVKEDELPTGGKSASEDKVSASNIDSVSAATPSQKAPVDPSGLGMPTFYPQGFDDVIEVLCTGETTAGKLLMHFLLYYGQYFDAQMTAIDISGKHERVFMGQYSPYSYYSPYIPRRAPETIDPLTGMLVVDHIVVYDPLEGAENNNVARRCFAWQQVKWIFSQSYATLSSAVERSSSPPSTPSGRPSAPDGAGGVTQADKEATGGDLMDPSSPLLRCLLSF